MAAVIDKTDENNQKGKNDKRKYLVELKRDICIGAASCVAIAPATFGLDDQNKVFLIESDWDEEDLILAAAQSCPVFAIIIKDAETGKQIFPLDDTVVETATTPEVAPIIPAPTITATTSAPTQPTL